jgi:hypothetical protein
MERNRGRAMINEMFTHDDLLLHIWHSESYPITNNLESLFCVPINAENSLKCVQCE